MTRPPESHLSSDQIDAWLDGSLDSEAQRHVEHCQICLEQLRAEREIADQIAALPFLSPAVGFADRVMASVVVPDPFALRSLQSTRRRLTATPKSIAIAASLAVVLLGSMIGSIAWSLGHQETLASIGSWLLAQGGEAAWLGIRGLASNVIEQPWYTGIRTLVENPARLALASAATSLAYLSGIVALRRLLALPTQQVVHAGI
ncbi:MAG: hypothetical protein ACJ8BF_10100 [Gemmatimonadales bacterium]